MYDPETRCPDCEAPFYTWFGDFGVRYVSCLNGHHERKA